MPHRRHSGGGRPGGDLRFAEGLLQRQRGHLLHHAELDQPLRREHAADPGEGGDQPLYLYPGQYQRGGHSPLPGPGRPVQQEPVRGLGDSSGDSDGGAGLGFAGEDQAGL